MLKKSLLVGVLIAFLLLLGKGFMLHTTDMYGFHDITQAGRVSDFALSVRSGNIPPRIAPTFSYGLGYPIFNHYAPTAYWITSDLHHLGLSIPYALKLSFFMAVLVGGISMSLFVRQHLSEYAALVAGTLYASSPFVGGEIFVRGNLAEIWFMALLPLTLYLVHKVTVVSRHKWSVALAFTFSLLMTSHNALSMVGGAFVVMYSLMRPSRRLLMALVLGGLMSAYFLIPAVFELSSTHATEIAKGTMYAEHFVCPRQLWNSPLGFGGSMNGCIDGMSFQLGKILLIMGLLGLGAYVASLLSSKQRNTQHIALALLALGSLILTTRFSEPVWVAVEPILELFQFPWRFLSVASFGLAFFAGIAIDSLGQRMKPMPFAVTVALICVVGIFLSIPFFQPNPDKKWTKEDFTTNYLSEDYLRNQIAYRVPEYIPADVDVDAWMALKDGSPDVLPPKAPIISQDGELYTTVDESPFGYHIATSSKTFLINKHMSPQLSIRINNKEYKPTALDALGRPQVTVTSEKTLVDVSYVQTPLEKVSNAVTLIALILLVVPYIRTFQSWKKMS